MAAEQSEVKSITNIYYVCLERIFDFLDLKDLLNVADTCNRLQIAATAYFSDEYGNKRITLNPYRSSNVIEVYEDEINVSRKACLPLLRCFGAKIKDLVIEYAHSPVRQQSNKPEEYINRYCADSLTSISFCRDLNFTNEIIKKPFKNVVDLCCVIVNLENKQANLVNWFPNMRSLYLMHVSTPIDVTFPHLEHFSIRADADFPIEYIANFLRVNQQLQSFDIQTSQHIPLPKLLDVISENPLITKLCVSPYIVNPVNVEKAKLMEFAAKRQMMVELHFGTFELVADDVIVFLGQMNSLKKFSCFLKNRSECDRLINQLDNEWQHNVDTPLDHTQIIINR